LLLYQFGLGRYGCVAQTDAPLWAVNFMKSAWQNLFWGPFSRYGLGIAAATFLIDQAHKWWMLLRVGMREGERIAVTSFFDWYYVLNKGVSYSFLTGSDGRWQLALAVFAAISAVLLTVWLARGVENRLAAAGVGLIIGGALGNGLDRLTLGGVADFFSLHAYGFYWYIFNIADIAIVAGVAGLLYESVYTDWIRKADPAATKPTQTDR
jgi:signal peptidase II